MKHSIFSIGILMALWLLTGCSQTITTPGGGVVLTQATVTTAPESTTTPINTPSVVTPTMVPTTPPAAPTSVPSHPTPVPPKATPTATTPAGPSVSGVWTGYGPSDLTGTGNDCFTLNLAQVPNSNNVIGSFGESARCVTPYLAVSGTFNGTQLLLKNISTTSAQTRSLVVTLPAQPEAPLSSCGPTTIALTYFSATTMTGTVTNCTVATVQFQR